MSLDVRIILLAVHMSFFVVFFGVAINKDPHSCGIDEVAGIDREGVWC